MNGNKIIYSERQNFFSPWLIVLLLCVYSFPGYRAFVSGQNIKIALWVGVGLLLFFLLSRLCLQIDKWGMEIRFLPFIWKKRWDWETIDRIYVRKYSLWEYGGWGIRFGRGGIAYTTKGRYGIQVVLRNGSKVLIGTQHPHEVEKILNELKREKNESTDQSI